jgi:hypothetical protein
LYSALFRPFVHGGEVEIRYRCHGRRYAAFIRMSDIGSDLFTVKELAADGVYRLDPGFVPDLVVDSGGNIGLFSLQARAAYPSARIVICEPVPRSIAQIRKHLQRNGVQAEILPVCLGCNRRHIPFYIREAIGSSFDPDIGEWIGLRHVSSAAASFTLFLMALQLVVPWFFAFLTNSYQVIGELHRGAVWQNV